jgi:hypothetical protein
MMAQSMVSAKREGDWIGERFKLYAKCVRSIILLSTTELEQSWGKDFIRTSYTVINAWMQYSDQYTLFPHLRNLLPMKQGDEPQMTEGVRSAFVSCLARAPLEKFGMEIDGATWRIRDPNFKPDGGDGTIIVLHSIETSLSGAVDVYTGVRGLPLALSKLHDTAILNMRYLQRLCTGFPLSFAALSHLAALPNLQELSMERDCHLPPELGLGPLVIENSPFPVLCILAASVSSFTSLEFLFRSISSSTLKNIHLLMHTPSFEGAPLGMERVHNILVKGPSRNALREVRYSVQARPFWSSHFSVLERAAKPFVGTGLQQLVYYRCVFLIKEYEYLGLAPLLDFVRLPSQVLPVHQENPLL